MMPSAVLYVDI